MKRLLTTLIALAILVNVLAQSPEKMSYQAVIRNSSNQLVTSKTVGLRICILQGSSTGTVVYSETLTPTTNANGLVTLEFGGGAGFNTINWESGLYFIKTETDPEGGTNYTITGTNQLLCVPYALYANTAGNGFSGNYTDLTNKPKNIVTLADQPAAGDILYFNGTNWVTLPKGADGNVLSVLAGMPVWQSQQAISLLPPTVTNLPATDIQINSVSMNGIVNANGLRALVGVQWGYDTNYGHDDREIVTITGTENTNLSYALTLSNISGKTIHYRIYASNAVGTTYGNDMSCIIPVGVPKLSELIISSIEATAATCYSNIISNGGSLVTASGICWSTNQTPTVTDSHSSGGITEDITCDLTGLTGNTTYYVRAYATNEYGTNYSEQKSFNSGYPIGSSYAGGLVFYNDGNGHGLVCAPIDQSTGAVWGCSGTIISDGIIWGNMGSGSQYTTAIVTGCTALDIAARICYDLSLNGYDDWFLPSYNELNSMYYSLKVKGIGNFGNNTYWSSNQSTGSPSASLNFNALPVYMNGSYDITGMGISKNTACYVRAVRAF